eukprot:1864622-Pleurochrysis_carterae.AAC.1
MPTGAHVHMHTRAGVLRRRARMLPSVCEGVRTCVAVCNMYIIVHTVRVRARAYDSQMTCARGFSRAPILLCMYHARTMHTSCTLHACMHDACIMDRTHAFCVCAPRAAHPAFAPCVQPCAAAAAPPPQPRRANEAGCAGPRTPVAFTPSLASGIHTISRL